jgi:hypothetical protein
MSTSRLSKSVAVLARESLAVALWLALHVPIAGAQTSSEAVPADAAKRAEIIDSVSAALRQVYVFPDVAARMEEHIRQRARAGAYDEMGTVDVFAEALTEDLRSISHDLHLGVGYVSPEAVARMTAERDPAAAEREEREELARRNFTFRRVEILPGNVGYLRFDNFIGAEYAGPTAIAAMNFLANCDALIVDLRYNGGGDPSLIQLISSYFFEEPVHLNSFYIRRTDSTDQFWTQAHVEGPRLSGVDIYVLTSDRTFSGAEEFSYNLKNLKRGTIVGDTTGGGAHPVEGHLVAHLNVGIRVPFGRAVNPITGTNWEGVGVIPDIAVPAEQALDQAHIMALRKLRERESDKGRAAALDWAIQGLEATLNPVSVDARTLRSYAGTYGPRRLSLENGVLWYQRESRPRMRAIPMTDHLFRFEETDEFRLEVVTDASGRPTKLVGHYDDGTTDESPRSGGR